MSVADAGSEAPRPIPDFANAVAVDRSGDAVVAGLHLRRPGAEPGCDFFAAKVLRDGAAVAWRTEFPDCNSDEATGPANGEQVFIDPAGDVVVGKRATRSFVVLKLAGATGAVLWNQHVDDYPKHGPFVHTNTLDADGNVIVAGGFGKYSDGPRTDFVVAKLDGGGGSERWRRTFRGSYPGTEDHDASSHVRAVATDASGDVLASGSLVNGRRRSKPHRRWTIVKLAGADGATRWKRDVGETFTLLGGVDDNRVTPFLAVDAGGDVVSVATTTRRGATNKAFLTVVKLAGGTGRERWRHTLSAHAWGGSMLAITADGGVAVAGGVRRPGPGEMPSILVAVLEGTSGRERWRRVIAGSARQDPRDISPLRYDAPAALAVDASGRVFLAGLLRNAGAGTDFVVIAFDAASGSERWRRVIDGGTHGDDGARSLALSGGDVLAVGEVENPGSGVDGFVVALAASSGDERWRLLYDGSKTYRQPETILLETIASER